MGDRLLINMEQQQAQKYIQAAQSMGLVITETPKKVNDKYFMELSFSKPDSVEVEINVNDIDVNITATEQRVTDLKAKRAEIDKLR